MIILGISAYYHDSAACLVEEGVITYAAQEERFTRVKHDQNFPLKAIEAGLEYRHLKITDIDYIVFYDKSLIKFERILDSHFWAAPRGISTFIEAMPIWMKQKLWLRSDIEKKLRYDGKILFTQHHQAHAASAFFPSPFQEAAFLTVDGVGEWTTTSYGFGKGNSLKPMMQQEFPHSLGLLYSAFTYYTGFKVNSGEYKLMGLAPYGKARFAQRIYDNVIDLQEDGSFRLNMDYFDFVAGQTMTNDAFHQLFDAPPRKSEEKLTQHTMDLARSIQEVTEEIILRMGRHIYKQTKLPYLCMAGGVALNCVANARLLKDGPFKNIWIQPAAGDAGGALGSAMSVWYEYLGSPRQTDGKTDAQQGSYLGPDFSQTQIKRYLENNQIPYQEYTANEIAKKVATLLNKEQVIGWFQGRMEFGPRALGSRSIIGDARSSKMQSIMNLKIKYRESFRPFAPSVLEEKAKNYFDIAVPSPYMLLTAEINKKHMKKLSEKDKNAEGLERLYVIKSDIPAITHVDNTARLQTVNKQTNPLYHQMISEFEKITGCPVIINTSFNVRGEPIVFTPEDAYTCFMRTEMDYLVMGNFFLDKKKQPQKKEYKKEHWQKDMPLD